jgi:hypothetical protein
MVARKFTLSPFSTYLQLDLHEYRDGPRRFPVLKRRRNAATGVEIVDELRCRMFDEFPSAIREAIGLMIDGGMLIDRYCCLRSGISVVRIEAPDGYSVRTLIANCH